MCSNQAAPKRSPVPIRSFFSSFRFVLMALLDQQREYKLFGHFAFSLMLCWKRGLKTLTNDIKMLFIAFFLFFLLSFCVCSFSLIKRSLWESVNDAFMLLQCYWFGLFPIQLRTLHANHGKEQKKIIYQNGSANYWLLYCMKRERILSDPKMFGSKTKEKKITIRIICCERSAFMNCTVQPIVLAPSFLYTVAVVLKMIPA